jgi:hypothetical protein
MKKKHIMTKIPRSPIGLSGGLAQTFLIRYDEIPLFCMEANTMRITDTMINFVYDYLEKKYGEFGFELEVIR